LFAHGGTATRVARDGEQETFVVYLGRAGHPLPTVPWTAAQVAEWTGPP
jgi:hypothetical protein